MQFLLLLQAGEVIGNLYAGNFLQPFHLLEFVHLEDVPQMDEFQQMERLEAVSGVKIPGNLSGLLEKKELHTGVIEKTAMLDFVMGL